MFHPIRVYCTDKVELVGIKLTSVAIRDLLICLRIYRARVTIPLLSLFCYIEEIIITPGSEIIIDSVSLFI
jgi:hypothetical protein